MIYDYLLVGHGLAGSILAHTLAGNGYKILVIDQFKPNSASNIAAGLMNPLAGKRFAKSWLADTLVPFATQFYQNLEKQLGEQLFFSRPILKLFSTIEEQNNWMGKSAENAYNDFIKTVFTSLPVSEIIHQDAGGIVIDKGGYVNVPLLLQKLRNLRESRNELLSENFDFNFFEPGEDVLKYKQIFAKNIIFSEGYQGAKNPFFKWLPFSLNKGEVLDIKCPDFPSDYIYNKAVYVVGIKPFEVRVGATYNWREVDESLTESGRQELEIKLSGLIKKPFAILQQHAGIRPAVRDRRPLIGTHPGYARIKLFNGMGSKGVMMAPYLAHHFMVALESEKDVMPEVNILRYITLYQEYTKLK